MSRSPRVLRGLLFDLDGTLVDTAAANFGAYAAALREAGIVVETETIADVAAGRHWTEFLPDLLRVGRSAVAPEAR